MEPAPALHASLEAWRLGLVGFPLGHSLSPALHAAALQSLGLPGDYRLFPVPPGPEGERLLRDLLARLRGGELQGLNVTIPHKQRVLDLLDELSPAAEAIGAANTLVCRAGLLVGENTDAPGFLADLARFAGDRLPALSKTALVLGAGGSARAVVYALADQGWEVCVAARRPHQAGEVAHRFSQLAGPVRGADLAGLPAAIRQLSGRPGLVINTTPVGMHPQVEVCPWPEGLPLPDGTLVYDLVYNPARTRLVARAHRQGLVACTGLGMLVEQAALSFEVWTGCKAPPGVWWEAAQAYGGLL